MRNTSAALLGSVALVAVAASGCASTPAAPFNTLKDSTVTAYRLQNYEPPAATPGSAAAAAVPGLPPQIQQWIEQGAAGLQQLIPPGILPPGILPQPGQVAPMPQAQDTTPRFHTFRILSQTQVIDPNLKESLAEILGDEDKFQAERASCSYAELGLSFTPPGGQPNDLLISFSCNHVMPQTFAWPHRNTGLKPDTVRDLAEVVNKLWPPGT
jgi:hypothetical protein